MKTINTMKIRCFKTFFLSITMVAVLFFMSCSSDDGGPSDSSSNSWNNVYNYKNKNISIKNVSFLETDGDVYLFFEGSNPLDVLQFRFNAEKVTDLDDLYILSTSGTFWGGAVTGTSNPLGDAFTSGSITVNSVSSTKIDVQFYLSTTEGPLTGLYSGNMTER